MQCRQTNCGKNVGNKTIYDEMDIHSCDTSNHVVCMCVLGWRSPQKTYLVRKLTKVHRLAGLMILSAFPGTPTGALKILLNITPIEEFLLAEAGRGSYRITVSGSGMSTELVPLGKQKAMLMFAMKQEGS